MKLYTKYFVVLLCITVLAPIAFAGGGQEDSMSNVMVAALDNGPGGNNGSVGIPYGVDAGHTLMSKLYTPLTIFDEQQENIVPHAADSWTASSDFRTWVFVLHPNLTWSDGKKVTASDMVFTANFVTDPSWISQSVADRNFVFANVADVSAVSDSEVQFTLNEPDPRFFAKVYRAYILPEHAIDFSPADTPTTDWWVNPDKQVGSGAFSVSGYQQDDFLELLPNKDYFEGTPKLDKLIIKFFGGDETASTLALAGGDIHFSYINFDDIETLGSGFTIHEGSSGVPRFLSLNFNNLSDVWDDIRVRRAIYHAIDREAITQNVFAGTHEPIPAQILSKTTWSNNLNDYPYDPDKARQLLSEAGVDPADLSMNVIGYKSDPATLSAMQAVQSYLAEVGITFNHTALQVAAFREQNSKDGSWEITYRGSSGLAYAFDPNQYFANDGVLGGDFSGFDYEPYFTDIINDINVASTADEFTSAISRYNDTANDLATKIYLWAGKAYGASSNDVKGFHWYPTNGGGPFKDHPHLWTLE